MKLVTENKKNALFTLVKRVLSTLALLALIIYLAIWILSPTVSRWLINKELATHDLILTDESVIRLNPFLLKLSISDVKLDSRDHQKTFVTLELAELDINTLALFSKHILIESLELKGANVKIEHDQNVTRVAGFDLTSSDVEPTNAAKTDEDAKLPKSTGKVTAPGSWRISAQSINWHDMLFEIRHQQEIHELVLKLMNLKKLEASQTSQKGQLEIAIEMNRAPLSLKVDFDQNGEQGEHQVAINLERLSLDKLAYLLKDHFQTSLADFSFRAEQTVTIRNNGLKISASKLELDLDNINLLSHSQLTPTLVTNGIKLEADSFKIKATDLEWQNIDQEQLSLTTQFNIMNKNLRISDAKRRDILLAIGAIKFENGKLALDNTNTPSLSLEKILLQQFSGSQKFSTEAKKPIPAVAKFSELQISTLNFGDSHLSINAISFDDLKSAILLDQSGQLANLISLSPQNETAEKSSTPEKTDNPPLTEAKTAPKSPESNALSFSLGKLEISNNSLLVFEDESVTPKFSQQLSLQRFSISDLDSRAPEKVANFDISFKADEYSSAKITGSIRPFAKKLNLELNTTIEEFSLPKVSPYMKTAMGFEMLSGQFDNETTLKIVDDEIDGEAKLAMRGLELSSTDDVEPNLLESQTAMPLNSALNMLKDSDDNLELDVPLSGNVSSPEFGISSFVTLVTKKAVMSAAESYLINTFVPYANVLSVVRIAGEYALKISFEDLKYTPTVTTIQPEQHQFLNEFGALLNDNPETQVKVCAIATSEDLPNITKDANTPEYVQQLKQISEQRGLTFKAWVIEHSKIESSKLLLCQPRVDLEENAVPRIEFAT